MIANHDHEVEKRYHPENFEPNGKQLKDFKDRKLVSSFRSSGIKIVKNKLVVKNG